MRALPALLGTLLLIAACSVSEVRPGDVSAPMTWGASENVTHVHNLYFSEQPDEKTLRFARANGATTVVNLRAPGEMDWDQEAVTRKLGMDYVILPVSKKSDSFDRDTVQKLNALVNDRRSQTLFFHCSSGNRAAGWYAIYLVEVRGMSADDAIPIARQVGLTKPEMEARVRNYLANNTG